MVRIVWLALMLALCGIASVANAADLGTGALPLRFEPSSPARFNATDEIRVEGIVGGTTPAAVALRVDDTASSSYPTRYNDERLIPPGPFRFAVGVHGLRTPSGRTLDAGAIARIVLFPWEGQPNVTITRFEIAPTAAMPEGVRGYSFGPPDAAVPSGFERIAPGDARLSSYGPIRAIHRPAPDPLVANGLQGVYSIVLPAPAPRVRVTVWSEDPGEWETLPHPFDRRIQVNGAVLIDEPKAKANWINARYLRGGPREHTPTDDAWTAYGAERGNARSIDVNATAEGVVIDITGPSQEAHFINAVVIEPIAAGADTTTLAPGQAFAQAQRAQWYRTTFPVVPEPARSDDGAVAIALASGAPPTAPISLSAAPDTGSSIRLAITSDVRIDHPLLKISAPRLGNTTLATRVWAGQYKLERDNSVLHRRDNRLLADPSALPLIPGTTRHYHLWVDVPKAAPPGTYTGTLTIGAGYIARSIPITIAVLPVTLPPTAKPAGFYLARAAHLNYFPALTLDRERQVRCDLDLLAGFGLTNTAPPISGLDRDYRGLDPAVLGVFAGDMQRAQSAGVAPGWLIYNTLADLATTEGVSRAVAAASRAEEFIKTNRLPQPLWSVADEPSNPDQAKFDLAGWIGQLRAASPGIRLAGHLNTPGDLRFASLFDTVLLNPGFGIDADKLDQLKASGKSVWLYNTSAPRQTAGLWLWRTSAERYVQWHARMPTADPFDPIDGREADFQMIYPSAAVCLVQPDIHRDLLAMAEGIVDQRWLLWLDAQTSEAARRLAKEVRAALPGPFADARAHTPETLDTLRARIMNLAALN